MNGQIAFIGLGSNLGDRRGHLAAARKELAEVVTVERASSIYETEPVDVQDQPWFLNQVVMARCRLTPFDLLTSCLAIERRLGRVRTTPRGPRIIDLDILLYDDLALDQQREGMRLIIPHPRMHLRRFVLVPVCELDGSRRHPVLGQTMERLLAAVNDPSRVFPLSHPPG